MAEEAIAAAPAFWGISVLSFPEALAVSTGGWGWKGWDGMIYDQGAPFFSQLIMKGVWPWGSSFAAALALRVCKVGRRESPSHCQMAF